MFFNGKERNESSSKSQINDIRVKASIENIFPIVFFMELTLSLQLWDIYHDAKSFTNIFFGLGKFTLVTRSSLTIVRAGT